jgi:hypothetical protein
VAQQSLAAFDEHSKRMWEQIAAVAPRLQRALAQSDRVGQLGWTVVPSMPLPLML